MTEPSSHPDTNQDVQVPLRARNDLTIHPVWFGRTRYWGIKDPIALRYFQLRDEEYHILKMLDGRITLDRIRERFERIFAPQRLALIQLQSYLVNLHRQGLVVSDLPDQGGLLLGRQRDNVRRRRWDRWFNVLAIRFRGLDPEPLLCSLYPKTRWMFSKWCLLLCLLLTFSAMTLAVMRIDVIIERLPAMHMFFSRQNIIWMLIALATAKIFHEFGHALTCKHFGGECHEMGVMLLAFTPCIYCNVSDAWMIANKWHRIAVSAAGVVIELVLASLGLLLWHFSYPGPLNSLCLNLAVVCSISTLIFNGNPLMRFDGYYIFSDLINIPNLRRQSTTQLKQALSRCFLGLRLVPDRMLPPGRQWLLISYAVASTVYRLTVLCAILWFMDQTLKPYRLDILVHFLAVTVVGSIVVVPLLRLVRFVGNPDIVRANHRLRLAVRGSLAVLIAGTILLTPLPSSVKVPVLLEPAATKRLYATTPGNVASAREIGQSVRAGDPVMQLNNELLRQQTADLRTQKKQIAARLQNLKRQAISDPASGIQIPTTEEKLSVVTTQLDQKVREQQNLTLRSPIAGILLPAPAKPTVMADQKLPTWSGSALDPQNHGCYVERETLLCLIGDRNHRQAVLVIDQSDIALIKTQQRVEIQLDQLPGQMLWGTIAEIGELDLEIAPRELLLHADLPIEIDPQGIPRPLTTTYRARVVLDHHPDNLLLNASGYAKVYISDQSLAHRLIRFLSRSFHW
ncbi:MAG: hypothetical protein ABGZ17_23570 [Planctomycetaceae bacterium]